MAPKTRRQYSESDSEDEGPHGKKPKCAEEGTPSMDGLLTDMMRKSVNQGVRPIVDAIAASNAGVRASKASILKEIESLREFVERSTGTMKQELRGLKDQSGKTNKDLRKVLDLALKTVPGAAPAASPVLPPAVVEGAVALPLASAAAPEPALPASPVLAQVDATTLDRSVTMDTPQEPTPTLAGCATHDPSDGGGHEGGGSGGVHGGVEVEDELSETGTGSTGYSVLRRGTCFSKEGALHSDARPAFLDRVNSALKPAVDAVFDAHLEAGGQGFPDPEAHIGMRAVELMELLTTAVPCETLDQLFDTLSLAACCLSPGHTDVYSAIFDGEAPYAKPAGRNSEEAFKTATSFPVLAQAWVVVKYMYRTAANVAGMYKLPKMFAEGPLRLLGGVASDSEVHPTGSVSNHMQLLRLACLMNPTGSAYDTNESLGLAFFENLSAMKAALDAVAFRPNERFSHAMMVMCPGSFLEITQSPDRQLPKEILTAVSFVIALVYGVGKTATGVTPGGADQLLSLLYDEWLMFITRDLTRTTSRPNGDTASGNAIVCLLALYAVLRLPSSNPEAVLLRRCGWSAFMKALDMFTADGGPWMKSRVAAPTEMRDAIKVMYEATFVGLGLPKGTYDVGSSGEKALRFRPFV